ncbi:T9SS type B sorting domain-containing protein [Flavobacterium antarcticum]|uniref:T9SS type B sorting domain-containing protein n=1 Tax=Flavobacterium antarcticum TaxID=271155 RepID=UPI0003B5BB99|nr:T9SS type B sorting domain-containing protein [Flavobacterium antarcticum]
MIIGRLFCLFLFLTASTAYSQLSDFNFTVTVVAETCTNNGSIEMIVANTEPNAELTYQLFLAPEFTNPMAETAGNSFSGLTAGSYRVVAIQSNNGDSNSKQIDVVVEDLIETLDFEMDDSTATNCDTTATLTVNIISGNPTFFEIISGPETRSLQTSNEFSGLSSGTYIIRVFDECDDALSKAYTFVLANNDLNIGAPQLPKIYTSCTSVEIINKITSNTSGSILYPLQVKYTVLAPNNTVAQIATQTISSGPTDVLELSQNINLFGGQLFSVQIEVTDNCNNVFTQEFQVNPNPKLNFVQKTAECGALFFAITVTNYFPPFTLNFTEPAEFNPLLFNTIYPGPYNQTEVVFGSINNTVPFGNYEVSVQDGCGRTANLDFSLTEKPIKPSVNASNNGCDSDFGKVTIKIPGDREIVAITMTQAPANYPQPIPANVIAFVNSTGVYNHPNLPVGDYEYFITDSCGDTYTVEIKVPAFVFGNLTAVTRPDCSPISGAVKLATSNGPLTMVTITAAPPTFTQALPYDASFNIDANGVFYMSNLPAGNYSFTAKDTCGFDLATTAEISGYTSSSNGFSINRKCGAFDITMNDTDTSITGKTFWLQKFFPATNSWGHPITGAAFTEGTIPNSTTARELTNPGTAFNIFIIGDFRIIKVFESFNNGNANAKCSDLYVEFKVAPELIISGVYNLNCNNGTGPNDLVMDVVGVAPFNFQITAPFTLDNGENNLFTNLPEGVYNFRVTDACGNIKNISVEIGNLLPLARANPPQSMLVCRNDGVQFGIFPLVNQTPQVLGNQNPNNYNVNYYLTQADADSDTNPLPDGYTNVSNPQTIFVRVEHKVFKLCYATTSFTIFAGITPILTPVDTLFLCKGFTKTLTADAGFLDYEWSTGETTQSITVNQPGTYTVTVKNTYQDFSCDASKDFVVEGSSRATIQTIDTSDWSSNNNSMVIVVQGSGDYVYSLDDENYQTSNSFTDLSPGIYTVYVKDVNGCGTVKEEFFLLNYPKYFTPNSDGFNDTWHVQFSVYEPNLNVDIFDRFGKFIIRLKGGDAGWNGMYNGNPLPSTDYWFVVTREDGKIYRGHFSLKR